MSYKLVIRKIVKKKKPPISAFEFYHSFMFCDGVGFANFVANCRSVAINIIASGSAFPATKTLMVRREMLGLPHLEFNETDTRKLAEATGLAVILERSK